MVRRLEAELPADACVSAQHPVVRHAWQEYSRYPLGGNCRFIATLRHEAVPDAAELASANRPREKHEAFVLWQR